MLNEFKCYAMRYPDLLAGYCHGDINRCDWKKLEAHYNTHGKQEYRYVACKNEDTECYAQRYENVWGRFCHSQLQQCDWEGLLQYWMLEGQFRGEHLGCIRPNCSWREGNCAFACGLDRTNIQVGCPDQLGRVPGGQCLLCSDMEIEIDCSQAYFVDSWLAKSNVTSIRTCVYHDGKCVQSDKAINCARDRSPPHIHTLPLETPFAVSAPPTSVEPEVEYTYVLPPQDLPQQPWPQFQEIDMTTGTPTEGVELSGTTLALLAWMLLVASVLAMVMGLLFFWIGNSKNSRWGSVRHSEDHDDDIDAIDAVEDAEGRG